MKTILLGGGPSLRGVLAENGTTLPHRIVGVNSAALFYPGACAVFSSDRVWIESHRSQLERFHGPVVLAWDGELPAIGHHTQWIDRHRGNGLARNGVNSSTSGFAALNWAVRCGAKHILLLGYDYRTNGQHRHWYDDPAEVLEPGRAVDLWPQWVGAFNEAVPELRALGVEVMNGSPESAITAFQKCTPQEGLRWYDDTPPVEAVLAL